MPCDVPARVRQVLRVCLQKDPKQRAQAIGDVRLALEGAFETTASADGDARVIGATRTTGVDGRVRRRVLAGRRPRRSRGAASARDTAASPPETRLDIVTPATDDPTSFALSPDGRQIVFVASGDGVSRLWLRSLATTTAQPLAGTEGAQFPFWSPDGRSLGFFAAGELKRLDLGGGAPQTLAPAAAGRGGTWNADGVIVFAPSLDDPPDRVSATGGRRWP